MNGSVYREVSLSLSLFLFLSLSLPPSLTLDNSRSRAHKPGRSSSSNGRTSTDAQHINCDKKTISNVGWNQATHIDLPLVFWPHHLGIHWPISNAYKLDVFRGNGTAWKHSIKYPKICLFLGNTRLPASPKR